MKQFKILTASLAIAMMFAGVEAAGAAGAGAGLDVEIFPPFLPVVAFFTGAGFGAGFGAGAGAGPPPAISGMPSIVMRWVTVMSALVAPAMLKMTANTVIDRRFFVMFVSLLLRSHFDVSALYLFYVSRVPTTNWSLATAPG
jgi:hypothetical protein